MKKRLSIIGGGAVPPNKRLYQSVDDAIREYQAKKLKKTTDTQEDNNTGSF
jgi:hypothetical protein